MQLILKNKIRSLEERETFSHPLLHALFSGKSIGYWNILCEYIPDLASNYNVPQPPEHHPEGPVHIHICKVIDNVAFPILRIGSDTSTLDYTQFFAAIFHDIGKSFTHVETDGKHSFIDHELKSLEILQKYDDLLYEFKVSKSRLEEIVGNHMRAHLYISGEMQKQSKRKEFESLKYFRDLIQFANYDKSSFVFRR